MSTALTRSWRQYRREGIDAGRDRIARLVRELGLISERGHEEVADHHPRPDHSATGGPRQPRVDGECA